MYKILIEITEANTQDKDLIELVNNIKQEFLKQDNVIVYFNSNEESKENVSAHMKIGLNNNNNGPEVQIDEKSKVSNGLAKEVYKELQKIYYDKRVDNGIIYMVGLSSENNPFIVLNIISKEDKEDREWLVDNNKDIARAICDGTMKSFGLKQC